MNRLLSLSLVATMAALLFPSVACGQSNGLNPFYSVTVQDLQYNIPDKKTTVGSVLGSVAEALAGQATDNNRKDMVPQVNAAVKAAISKTYRLKPVDSGEQTTFTLSGEITRISTTTKIRVVEEKNSKGEVTKRNVNEFEGALNISLTLKNNETGETNSNTFAATSNWVDGANSEAGAMNISIRKLRNRVTSYFDGMFPLFANIIERGEEKKDKTKQVYIDLGTSNGLWVGQHFTVFVVGNVAGRETRTKIGKLKLQSVEGEDISLCKVQSGGKDIKAAFDAGKKLVVINMD